MKYPKVVADARKAAKTLGITIIVYQEGRWFPRYDYAHRIDYEYILSTSKRPITKLLICMPDGHVKQ